ncbi:MAG: DUF4905 domain-containing protein [Cytophagales bacterium]|nr:MAG: DUF4905 domain-containing protein [Cytophagales bacterium]
MALEEYFKSFSHHFDGLIFKVLPDEVMPLLALEIRHTETKEVSFAVVDYEKSKLVFEGLGLEETWWVGMTAFYNGKLFFHSFADKQYPEPKGIIVADIFEQALIWEKQGVYLEEISKNVVYVCEIDDAERKRKSLDIQTGNHISCPDTNGNAGNDTKNVTLFPFQYAEGNPHFDTVALFLNQKLAISPIQQLDYLEFKQYIIIAYFIEVDKKMSRWLIILSQEGEILLHQMIDNQLIGRHTEVFFVVNDFLVAIANRKNLLIFKL